MNSTDQKIDGWSSRLLGLSSGSSLLRFMPAEAGAVAVTSPSAQEMFHALMALEGSYELPTGSPIPGPGSASTTAQSDSTDDVVAGSLTVDVGAADLLQRLYRLHRDSQTAMSERGVQILYLAVGALRRQVQPSNQHAMGPILLVPVKLAGGVDEPNYRLEPGDEGASVNPALAIKLHRDFHIDLPKLPADPYGVDVPTFLQDVAPKVSGLGWEVMDETWLGLFSLEKLVIYDDLENHRGVATRHHVVQMLAEGPQAPSGDAAVNDDMDHKPDSPETLPVLDADSSQMEVLARVQNGENLAVFGPPGTGKSQTATNLIAQSLRQGKRVLFVSAKMAALETVARRLDELGMGTAFLQLHSHHANKSAVREELQRALFGPREQAPPEASAEFERLLGLGESLDRYVSELHLSRGPRERSAFEMIGRLSVMTQVPDVEFSLPQPSLLELPDAEESSFEDALQQLVSVPRVLADHRHHPFAGWEATDLGPDEQAEVFQPPGPAHRVKPRAEGRGERAE